MGFGIECPIVSRYLCSCQRQPTSFEDRQACPWQDPSEAWQIISTCTNRPVWVPYLVLHCPGLGLGSQVPAVNFAFVGHIDQHRLRFGIEVIDLHNTSLALINRLDSWRALVLVDAVISLVLLQRRFDAEHVNGAVRTATSHTVRVFTHAHRLDFTTYWVHTLAMDLKRRVQSVRTLCRVSQTWLVRHILLQSLTVPNLHIAVIRTADKEHVVRTCSQTIHGALVLVQVCY